MYKLSLSALFLFLIGCNVPETHTEDVPTSKLDAVEALSAIEEKKEGAQAKMLAKASFTEPFMYAEIYDTKALFVFPEKDSLIAEHNFEPIVEGKDYEIEVVLAGKPLKLKLSAVTCTHPGSGETWDRKAEALYNGENFTGCAQVVKP